jgi:FtsH ternary system-like protein
VLLSPAIFKGLIESGGNDTLSRAWQSVSRAGISHTLKQQVTRLIAGCRHSAEVLTTEDIFELEHGSALADLGQRIATRQVISVVRRLKSAVQRIGKPRVTQRDVATQLLDEDSYPVGGFVSIATRGSLESLLHSQLAYMEPPGSRRPDLFDIKFLRDELLYYSRDENQFLRHRHVFVFFFTKSLSQARFKDPTLPAQRIIMAFGLVVAAIELLTEWLSEDALKFDLIFEATDSDDPLVQERALLQSLLQEAIASGTIRIKTVSDRSTIVREYSALAERLQCRLLSVQATSAPTADPDDHISDYLTLSGPHPATTLSGEKEFDDSNDPAESWQTALVRLVSSWLQ